MASMPKIHQGFGQIFNWDDKSDKFGKKLSMDWQDFFKSWQKRWQKGASWQMAIITEMANLATIHKVWQKLNEMTNEACWLFAIFTKMTNLVKIANLARSNEWPAKNSNEVAKNGLLVIKDFYEDSKSWRKCKFGKNTWKVWTKFKWEDNKGYLDNDWIFAKGKFLPKMVNLTKVYQMFGKKS